MKYTINILKESKVDFIMELLSSFDFIQIEEQPKDDNEEGNLLSDEEKSILDERWAKYEKEGVKGITWEKLKAKYKKLYGL